MRELFKTLLSTVEFCGSIAAPMLGWLAAVLLGTGVYLWLRAIWVYYHG